jgi:hypothetical protein
MTAAAAPARHRVLLAVAEVGTAIQLEETLGKVGLATRWDQQQAGGPILPPPPDAPEPEPDVVVLDADRAGARLAAIADAWREHPSSPGIVAIGAPAARDHAAAARVTLLSSAATAPTLRAAIDAAVRLRYTGRMSWNVARRALGLPDRGRDTEEAARMIAAARAIDLEVPRTALGWYAGCYVTDLGAIDVLRDARALEIPEVAFAKHLDGTLTLQAAIRKGPLDGSAAARLIWALASIGGVALTAEVHDVATPARRALAAARADVRGRLARLDRGTFYDVLEITPLADYPDVEAAYQATGHKYAPAVLAAFDLGELAAHVQPLWDQVEKARAVLVDLPARGRYHDWLRAKLPELRTVWAIDPAPAQQAIEIYARGQKALGAGDVHRALGELAAACRQHPGHPEYEASLAWARYRVQVGSGKDAAATARAERRTVEQLLAGTRRWPRALLALALLCAADNDPEAARFHIREALAADPQLAAAHQLLARLGARP